MTSTVREQIDPPTVVIDSQRFYRRIVTPRDAYPIDTPADMAAKYGCFEFELADSDDDIPRFLSGTHRGPFGQVVAAHLDDGTPVAVKTFGLREGISYDGLKWAASREFRYSSTFNLGPRFVRGYALLEVSSVDTTASPLFLLVMEFIHGKTLESSSPPEEDVQWEWLDQALEALEMLEDHRIKWQDIKPQNIMVRERDNTLVFIDHGSSRLDDAGTQPNNQHTPQWSAPEFFDTNEPTYASARFSVGLSMLSVFTGGNPYLEAEHNVRNSSGTAADAAYDARTRRGILNLHDPRLSPPVQAVLALMLQHDPDARPAPSELRAALRDPTFEADAIIARVSAHPYERITAATEPEHERSDGREEPVWKDLPQAPLPEDVPGPISMDEARLIKTSPPERERHRKLADLRANLLPLRLPADLPSAQHSWMINHAGADSTLVTAPGDRRQYRFIAVALIIYRLYIFAGVFSVGYQMTDSAVSALIGALTIGVFLGWALVNLDRSIVNGVRPNLDLSDRGDDDHRRGDAGGALFIKGWRYWLNIVARVVATVVVAFLIGDSVNVLIHQKDITANLATHQAAELRALQTNANSRFATQEKSLTAEVTTAQNAYNTAKGEGDRYRKLANDEEAGRSGTHIPGCGPECRTYLSKAHDADQYFQNNQARLTNAITTAQAKLTALPAAKSAWMAPQEAEIKRHNGPIAQSKALWEIATADTLSTLRYIAMLLVFAVIELFPVVMKLFITGNGYERSVARRAQLAELTDRRRHSIERTYIEAAATENLHIVETVARLQGAQRTLALERYASQLRRSGSSRTGATDGGLAGSPSLDE